MAQETRNVDYESMVDKYMNEWEGCNLREFCFNEKVNIYRMLTSDSSLWCLRTFWGYTSKLAANDSFVNN